MMTVNRLRRRSTSVWCVAWCLLLGIATANAQDVGSTNPAAGAFVLTSPGSLPSVVMGARRTESPEDQFIVVFSIHSGGECRVAAQLLEVPIQMDATGFEIKRALRVSQEKQADGSCREGLALVYLPNDFAYLATMDAVVVHLPTGPVVLTDAARQYFKSVSPRLEVGPPVPPTNYSEAIDRLNEMLRGGQAHDAAQVAEQLVSMYRSRPPLEGLRFYATLAMARRLNDNLDGAVLGYEVALLIGEAASDTGPHVGVVYDNLATVHRLQRRWDAAIAASDRALVILERTVGTKHLSYGTALHNRALIHAQQRDRMLALEYADRALAILRSALEKDDATLARIVEDNRLIREGTFEK